MATTLSLFPARIQFVNQDGTLTPEAYRALQIVFARVGGVLGDSGTDVFGQIFGVANETGDLSALQTDIVQPPASSKDFIGLMLPEVMQPVNDPNGVFSTLSVSGTATFGGTIARTDATVMQWGAGSTYLQGSSAGQYINNVVNGVNRGQFNNTGLSVIGVLGVTTGAAVGGATAGAGGLAFPATAVAVADPNTLDDYEEGTWTPTDNSGAALSFTVAGARYTKIGRLVHLRASITYPVTASVAASSIAGLPFAAASAGASCDGGALSFSSNGQNTVLLVNDGAATANFNLGTNGAAITNLTNSGATLRFSICYITA